MGNNPQMIFTNCIAIGNGNCFMLFVKRTVFVDFNAECAVEDISHYNLLTENLMPILEFLGNQAPTAGTDTA
jgi:hypothetical protein